MNLSKPSSKKIFISYAWGGESEKTAEEIERALLSKKSEVIRDKNGGLSYKGLIKEFMETLGKGHFVIVIISDKYLRSENCMYELTQIAKNGNLINRIFPIILSDAKIYNPVDQIKYLKYWEDRIKELNDALRDLQDVGDIANIQQELSFYKEIRKEIGQLSGQLKNMNALTPEMHKNTNYQYIYDRIENSPVPKPIIIEDPKPQPDSTVLKPSSNPKTLAFVSSGVILSIILIAIIYFKFFTKKSEIPEKEPFGVTVQIENENNQLLKNNGRVLIWLNNTPQYALINQEGQAIFNAIPPFFLDKTVKIEIEDLDDYKLKTADSLFLLNKNAMIKLKVTKVVASIPSPSTVKKTVKTYFNNEKGILLGIACKAENKYSQELASKMNQFFKDKGIPSSSGIVKSSFYSDGLFDKALNGSFNSISGQKNNTSLKYLAIINQGTLEEHTGEKSSNKFLAEKNTESGTVRAPFQITIIDLQNSSVKYSWDRMIETNGSLSNGNSSAYLYNELIRVLTSQKIELH